MKIGLGIGLGYSKESGGAVIPPAISSATISGTAAVGQTLTATASGVTGSPTPTLSYQWKRGATNIGTNSSTYPLVQADAGNTSNITCVVTGTNIAGSANATSNTIAQILTVRTSAFLTASAISDATIRGGLNTFDIGLIANSLDTKMKAVYPFVGGTASTHRFNFMNSADTDAAFRLAFSGTITHSANGIQGNGTNGFANTFLRPNVNLNSFNTHLSYYSRTDAENTNVEIGSIDGSSNFMHMHLRHPTNLWYALLQQNAVDGVTNTSSTGFYIGNRTANNVKKHFKNGVNIGTSTTATTASLNNFNIYLSALNNNGNPTNYSTKQCAFSSIGDGLSDAEAPTFYNLVQTLQTTLGRSVGVPIVSDSDAQAFIEAAAITNATEADATNTLVIGMKAQGLWTKMKAVYPMVGGTASAHKFNLKDPRDLDAAFRLSFLGGWTHSNTGALPNGTNAYAITFLNPSTTLTTSLGVSYYSRTNANTAADQVDIGLIQLPNYLYLTTQYNAGAIVNRFFGRCTSANFAIDSANPDARGFYYLGKTGNGANLLKSFKNGVLQDTKTGDGANPNNTVFLGAGNFAGSASFYTNRQCAFASINDGLTDTEATNYYTLVQAFQTSLGRQV
jgi:hypothetical protein